MPIDLTLNVHVSDEDLAAINHVVENDPEQQPGESPADAWVRRVWRDLGVKAPQAVYDKVNENRAAYLAALDQAKADGVPYKDASTRQAEDLAKAQQEEEEAEQAAQAERDRIATEEAARFEAAVAEAVDKRLSERSAPA